MHLPTGNVYYAYDEARRLLGEYDANLVPLSAITDPRDVGAASTLCRCDRHCWGSIWSLETEVVNRTI